jgi:RNA polymerase sigma factor (sigma-70 family)
MAADDLKTAIEDIHQSLLAEQEHGPSDRQLLTRFLEQRDEGAFAALVRRHAPMVWGVCRRVLHHAQDAEDAFQATFLVLVRRAASVTPREMVANWLYGVARQTALKARATGARRRQRERQVAQMPEPEARRDLANDLPALLGEELSRLPDKHRAVLVLCDLQGQTRAVAARHLGLPEGTVASRLVRARALLARRLARRGLAVTGLSLAAALAQEAASAPAAVIKAACSLAGAPAGAIPAQVAALTQAVVKAMQVAHLKKVAVVVLVLGVSALACGMLAAGRLSPAPPPEGEPKVEKSEPAERKGPPLDPLPAGAVAQFGSPRLQDFTIDRSAAFSPDGKLLATSGSNSPICVWDVATGALVRTYRSGSVYDLRWKPDGKLAVIISFGHENFLMQEFGGTAELTQEEEKRLRDEADRRERKVRNGEGKQDRLDRCFLSADGRLVVAIWMSGPNNDRRASVYRFATAQTADTAKPQRELAIPPGQGAWLSDDGKVLLTHVSPAVNEPHRLRAFDLTAGKDKPAWELTFAGGDVDWQPDTCLSPDGKRVVVLFWGASVELWDGPSGKRVRELGKLPWYYHHNNGERRGIDLARDGKRLALIDRDTHGQVGGRVVDVGTGRDVCRLARRPMPRSGGVARFSADGKRVASVSYGVAAVWNAETGEDACPLPGHRGDVNSVAVLPRGGRVVTAGEDLTVRAWDPATGKEAWRASLPQRVVVKFVTPDGAVVVEEDEGAGGPAQCLDAATGKPRPLAGKLAGAANETFLACSPDGKTVVTLDLRKPAFHVWSWPAGDLRTTVALAPPRQLRLVRCQAGRFTPDGKHFVAAMYYGDPAERLKDSRPDSPFVETWDLAAGKLSGQVELEWRGAPALLPHSTGLYYWGKQEIRDAVTGRTLVNLRVPEGKGLTLDWVRAAALSPDGRTVALAGGFMEQRVLLFETRTGRFREMLPAQGRSVTGLVFLPDGRLVSLGTTALVWSVGLHPTPASLSDAERAREWEHLSDVDPEKAWPAMVKLAGTPAEAVELIRAHVRAVPKLSDKTLDRIFRNLDAEKFEDREAASRELDHFGAAAVPRVKARRAEDVSAEVKARLDAFLAQYDRPDLTAHELRALRAVEVLEAAATPAARKLLADLAGGEPTARLTREAAGAVDRLEHR